MTKFRDPAERERRIERLYREWKAQPVGSKRRRMLRRAYQRAVAQQARS